MKIQEFTNLSGDKFSIMTPFFNYTSRNLDKVNTVVLHWTGGSSVSGAVNTLNPLRLGYHFLIEKNGNIIQGAPVNKKVSHGGKSYGPNGPWTNSTSIGISFVKTESSEFTEEMFDSCYKLILDLKLSLPNIQFITGHHWVSPGRKVDPYTFDFDRLINKLGSGFELWKTGYFPFPTGLSDCKCIKYDKYGNCVKSVGSCKGPGKFGYSERRLSTEVSDVSFQADEDTE